MFNLADIKNLVSDAQEPTLTLYVDVNRALEENQAQQPAWNIWLKNALNEQENALEGDAKRQWRTIRAQVDSYFDDYEPNSRGLAIFADENQLRDFQVPFSLSNQIRYGKPLVAPMVWAMDEMEPYLIALVDQEKAHFYVLRMGNADDQGQMKTDIEEYDFEQKTRVSQGGTGVTVGSERDKFEDTLQEHRNRFYRDVVSRIEQLREEQQVDRFILAGAEAAVSDTKHFIQGKLTDAMVDVLHIPLRSTHQELTDRVQPVIEKYEREQELALVQQVIDFAKSGGRGALGRKDVMDALTQGRVETLVFPWPFDDEKLATRLTLEALDMNSTIELVSGEAAVRLEEEGGLGARLYYAISSTTPAV